MEGPLSWLSLRGSRELLGLWGSRSVLRTAGVIAMMTLAHTAANAQTSPTINNISIDWLSDSPLIAGRQGHNGAPAMAWYDLDGDGPLPLQIVATGATQAFGGSTGVDPATVARWDGKNWHRVGPLGWQVKAHAMSVINLTNPQGPPTDLVFGGILFPSSGATAVSGYFRLDRPTNTWQRIFPELTNATLYAKRYLHVDPDGTGPLPPAVLGAQTFSGNRESYAVIVSNGAQFSTPTGSFDVDFDGPGPAFRRIINLIAQNIGSQRLVSIVAWNGTGNETLGSFNVSPSVQVNDASIYDADGPGPGPERVLVFTSDGVRVFDGQTFQTVSTTPFPPLLPSDSYFSNPFSAVATAGPLVSGLGSLSIARHEPFLPVSRPVGTSQTFPVPAPFFIFESGQWRSTADSSQIGSINSLILTPPVNGRCDLLMSGVVRGGGFNGNGGNIAAIQRWDGTRWSLLGQGLVGIPQQLLQLGRGNGRLASRIIATTDRHDMLLGRTNLVRSAEWRSGRWELLGEGIFALGITDLSTIGLGTEELTGWKTVTISQTGTAVYRPVVERPTGFVDLPLPDFSSSVPPSSLSILTPPAGTARLAFIGGSATYELVNGQWQWTTRSAKRYPATPDYPTTPEVTWDPDGPGGRDPVRVRTSLIETSTISRVSWWNGSQWLPLLQNVERPADNLFRGYLSSPRALFVAPVSSDTGGEDLLLVGSISRARGEPSGYAAILRAPRIPASFTDVAPNQSIRAGTPVTLSVSVQPTLPGQKRTARWIGLESYGIGAVAAPDELVHTVTFTPTTRSTPWSFQVVDDAGISTTVTRTVTIRPCNLADIAGPDQSIGADGVNSADDIIVYLNAFITGNLNIADISGPNQSQERDYIITTDDIIVYINRFFAPCE